MNNIFIKKIIFFLKLTLILSILFFHFSKVDDTPPRLGAHGDNFLYSYNLAKYGVYSQSRLDNKFVKPDNHFLPLIPLINFFIIKNDKNLKNNNLNCYYNLETLCDRSIIKYMKFYNIISLIFLIYFSYNYSKYFFTKNISFIIVIILLSGSWYYNILNSFKHELLASALFMGWVLFRQKFNIKEKVYYQILIGIMLGLLILTRSIFLVIVIVELFFFLKGLKKKQFLKSFIPISIILILITPWKLHQQMEVDKNQGLSMDLRDGKLGVVMSTRAEKNQMDLKDYFGGLLYFSPSGGMTILNTFFDYSYYKNWDRQNKLSFHSKMMTEDSFIKSRLKLKGQELSDKNMLYESLQSFLEKPVKHLATSFLFLYRGFWPDSIDRPSLFYAFFAFPFFLYFYFSKFFSIKKFKENFNFLIILSPVIFSILFHALFTHYQPRYSIPIMAPILIFYSGNILKYVIFKFNN